MARLLLLTAGTEGDVRPFVNLAARLVARGHEVGLAAPAGDAGMVAESGARHLKLAIDFRDMARQGQAHAAGLPGLIDRLTRAGTLTRVADALFDTMARGRSFRPDAIIAHPKYTGAADLAQALQVPWAQVALLPCIAPTAVVPNAALFARDMGPWANRASYCLTPLLARPLAGRTDRWRAEILGLPPRRKAPPPAARLVLNAFSTALLPRIDDWGPEVATTGFWRAEDDETADTGLPIEAAAFATRATARRRPLIHIGFGSMSGVDGNGVARSLARAIERADVAALVTTGWGGIDGRALDRLAGDRVLVLDRMPHARVFPHVDLVVHHGGVGTLATGLMAGRAAVICPWGADQPFWAARAVAGGYGLRGPGLRQLAAGGLGTGDRLGRTIRRALRHGPLTDTARRIGRRLRAEDGAHAAMLAIEDMLRGG